MKSISWIKKKEFKKDEILCIEMPVCIGLEMPMWVISWLLNFNNNHPITEKDWNIIIQKKKPQLHLHSSGKNLIPTYLCVFLVHTEALLEHHARFEGHCQSCKQWSCFQTTSGTSCVLEKCTYCITDQLTLSLGPHNDWHCTLRKLQTFTSADKTSVSPHTSFSTSPSLESLKSFMLGSSAAAICERWWRMVMEKLFIP